MKKIFTFWLLFLSLITLPLQAQEKENSLTVLELFTSQACPACAMADAAIQPYRKDPNAIILNWSVDYLDRFGWVDTFARPYHAVHQKAYNKRIGVGGMVYTPELIVDGRFECIGNNIQEMKSTIAEARASQHLRIRPEIIKDGDTYKVNLPEVALVKPAFIRAVWYLSDAMVDIESGDNAGKTLHITNVVRHTKVLGEWDGARSSMEIKDEEYKIPDHDGIAILIHTEYYHGGLIGAARTGVQSEG